MQIERDKVATVYGKQDCQACDQAVMILQNAGYTVNVLKIENPFNKTQLFKEFPTARSVPKIVVDEVKLEDINHLRVYLNNSTIL